MGRGFQSDLLSYGLSFFLAEGFLNWISSKIRKPEKKNNQKQNPIRIYHNGIFQCLIFFFGTLASSISFGCVYLRVYIIISDVTFSKDGFFTCILFVVPDFHLV